MRRFGSVFPFLEQGADRLHLGRLVANHDFVRALLRHGTFDEYVFSNPSLDNLRRFERALDGWNLSAARRARIRLVPFVDLPRCIAEEQFDVFHLGGWGYFMPGLHALRARHAREAWPITGVIHSLHGRDIVDHAVRVCDAGMATFDAICCTSLDGRTALARLLDAAARIAGRAFAGRLPVVPLGVDDDLVERRGDRAAGRARLQVQDDAVAVLVLGRLTPAQKCDLAPVIRALATRILPHAGRPVVLVLAGGAAPSDLALLRETIAAYGVEPHVRLQPNFHASAKADLLAACDIVLAPTDNTQETFGLSLLEAFAAGRPVIASRFDGYKDLVRNGVDGWLVDTIWADVDPFRDVPDMMDPNVAQLVQAQSVAVDLEQLCDRVIALVRDGELRQRMGEAGRERVDAEFRWSRIIGRYEALWAELTDEARRQGIPAGQTANRYAIGPTQIFGHYASRHLAPSDRLIARPPHPGDAPYVEIGGLLDPGARDRVLACAADGATVSELLAAANLPSDRGLFLILWLLKHGRLAFMPAVGP